MTFPGVTLNRPHTAVISATDNNSLTASATVNFDTFNPACYTFEAEDFDYGGGNFFDNPQTGAYAGLAGVAGIDLNMVNSGSGNNAYRAQSPRAGDRRRFRFALAKLQSGPRGLRRRVQQHRQLGKLHAEAFPTGNYYCYLRGSDGIAGVSDSASLSLVTGGEGTTSQTTTRLGTFAVPGTGNWQTYAWVPLLNSGNLVTLTNSGAVTTYRVTTDSGSYNANFYLLVSTCHCCRRLLPLSVNVAGCNSFNLSYSRRCRVTAIRCSTKPT